MAWVIQFNSIAYRGAKPKKREKHLRIYGFRERARARRLFKELMKMPKTRTYPKQTRIRLVWTEDDLRP